MEGIKQICEEKGILLILDEIQCGMGRSGSMFAYQQYGVEPDILTCAKALGCGIPIGAFLAKEEVAKAFVPGDHVVQHMEEILLHVQQPLKCLISLINLMSLKMSKPLERTLQSI